MLIFTHFEYRKQIFHRTYEIYEIIYFLTYMIINYNRLKFIFFCFRSKYNYSINCLK